ncbi:hypothetical protein H4S02_003152, partial [Coemansia sp. RSA 2611]
QQREERLPHRSRRAARPPPALHHHRVRQPPAGQRLVGHGPPHQLHRRLVLRPGPVPGHRLRNAHDLLLLRLLPGPAAAPQLPRRVQVPRKIQEGLGPLLRAGALPVHPVPHL